MWLHFHFATVTPLNFTTSGRFTCSALGFGSLFQPTSLIFLFSSSFPHFHLTDNVSGPSLILFLHERSLWQFLAHPPALKYFCKCTSQAPKIPLCNIFTCLLAHYLMLIYPRCCSEDTSREPAVPTVIQPVRSFGKEGRI